MSSTRKSDLPAETLKLYDKLVETNRNVQRKGATVPYTSVNGNMFSYLHSSGALALRLPNGEREKFLERYETKLFEAYGVVQKEYVTVAAALLAKTDELKPYFEMSHEYAKSLKPKATKKKGYVPLRIAPRAASYRVTRAWERQYRPDH